MYIKVKSNIKKDSITIGYINIKRCINKKKIFETNNTF